MSIESLKSWTATAAILLSFGVSTVVADSSSAGDTAANKRIKSLKADQPFWRWLANPHGREIQVILTKAEANRQLARGITMFSYQGTFQADGLRERHRALRDALGMLRYARKLDPDNRPVLIAIADTAAMLRRSDVAIDALESLLALAATDQTAPIAQHAALGVHYAQRRQWEKSATHLEIGISAGANAHTSGGFSYALVQMQRGRLSETIDFLLNIPHANGTNYQLALAVAYDRNDEEGRASAILNQLRTSQALASTLTQSGGNDSLIYTPAEDLHYFRALVYESSGHLAEARAEWLGYVRTDENARYRERALRHIQDIDALKETRPAIVKPTPRKSVVLPTPQP